MNKIDDNETIRCHYPGCKYTFSFGDKRYHHHAAGQHWEVFDREQIEAIRDLEYKLRRELLYGK